jgi:hypothetical protein
MSKRSSDLCPSILKLHDIENHHVRFRCSHSKNTPHSFHVSFLYSDDHTSMYALKWNDENDILSLRKL